MKDTCIKNNIHGLSVPFLQRFHDKVWFSRTVGGRNNTVHVPINLCTALSFFYFPHPLHKYMRMLFFPPLPPFLPPPLFPSLPPLSSPPLPHMSSEITGLTTMPCSTHSCEYLCLNINATHFHCLCPDSVPNCRPRSAECVHTSV